MLHEVLQLLNLSPGSVVVDGTLGGGGHSFHILKQTSPDGVLVGLDRDPQALAAARVRLSAYGARAILRKANFSEMQDVLEAEGLDACDAVLLDLGVSSHQLDCGARGFSFQCDAALDMRMDQESGVTAAQVVNEASVDELTQIFRDYGEERWARRIARRIEDQRSSKPVETTLELAELVKRAVPGGMQPARIHPATRIFQALRIYVNDELGHLDRGLKQGLELLRPGGVFAVISFHSLEDRRVKQFFREQAQTCVCPPRLPVCACGKKARARVITKRGVKAGAAEVSANPRARSAILRAIEKLPTEE